MTAALTQRLLIAIQCAEPANGTDDCAGATEEIMWENELARRVHGEPDVFMHLYEKYYDRILSFLYRRTSSLEEAQDLTSRTFTQALESLRSREQRLAFRPWLYRIAMNAHSTQLRGVGRWAARVRDIAWFRLRSVVLTPREHSQQREATVAVREALKRLPENYRTPLLLRFEEELSYDEIAQVLGIAPGSARSRVSRGLKLLEESITGAIGQPGVHHAVD